MILKQADDLSDEIWSLKQLVGATTDKKQRDAIERQLVNLKSGQSGERSAAHFLNREFGASANVLIIHDLRFEVEGEFAQIDHLVIHRVQRSAWVLETKNYAGRMTCDEHGDWTVWRGSKPQAIASPINQARRQCEWLRRWFDVHGFRPLRKIEPVVLISPTSSIDRRHLGSDEHVVKSDNFTSWWGKQCDEIGVATALGMFAQHLASGWSPKDFVALGERLVSAHVKATRDWITRFSLQASGKAREFGREKIETAASQAPPKMDYPRTVRTPHGEVTLKRVSENLIALRNEARPELIELVRASCRGKARWQPRYRNWLIAEARIGEVLEALTGKQQQAPHPRGAQLSS